MSIAWEISAGSVTRSLASWGITDARLILRNQAADTLSFRIVRANVLEEPAFAYGQTLILKADGAIRFTGIVTRLPAEGDGASEGDRYVVSGPWWQLENLVYQQPRKIRSGDFSTLDTEDTTRVILGQDEFGGRITTGAQVAQVLQFALLAGVPLVGGAAPPLVTAPLDECRDITCAEAIRRQLAFSPDVVTWCDYASAVPVFHFQKRDSLAAEEIAIDGGDRVVSWSLTPRNDLVPPGVVFIYVTTESNDEKTWTRITRDTAGVTSGVGVITATVEMMGAGTENQETPPTGLALQYFAALQTLPWEGEFVLHEQDCGADFHPGIVLNVSGGRSAWASMRAVVQVVTMELQRGLTSIEVGPPEHLAPQDFVNQILFNRKAARPPDPSNLATTKPPQKPDGSDNENAGLDPRSYTGSQTAAGSSRPMQPQSLAYCEDGEEGTVTVYGPPTA